MILGSISTQIYSTLLDPYIFKNPSIKSDQCFL